MTDLKPIRIAISGDQAAGKTLLATFITGKLREVGIESTWHTEAVSRQPGMADANPFETDVLSLSLGEADHRFLGKLNKHVAMKHSGYKKAAYKK